MVASFFLVQIYAYEEEGNGEGKRNPSTLQYFMIIPWFSPVTSPRVITAQKWPSNLHVRSVYALTGKMAKSGIFRVYTDRCRPAAWV